MSVARIGEGQVAGIFVGAQAQAPLTAVGEVRAEAKRGLEGDRYWARQGTFWKPRSDYEITLIELESLEALAAETGVALEARDARRNVATRGIRLNDLVNRHFVVGQVTLLGMRLCEPCAHLERLTGQKLRPHLEGRGGLRAAIVTNGVIRMGDLIREQVAETRAEGQAIGDLRLAICDSANAGS